MEEQVTVSLDLYHINYIMAIWITTIICKSAVLVSSIYERSPTEISWEQYWKFIAQLSVVNNMFIQSTWAYPLIVQAVADALNVSIQMVKSNLGFSPILNSVNLVQEQNSLSTIITIGRRIDEYHFVSTTPLQWNPSISMYNKSTIIDIQSSLNKHFIMSV